MLTQEIPAKHWETDAMRWKWTERQLYELGALARGMVQTHSERVADLVEQIDELRKELKAVHDKLDKVAEFVKAHVKKENGA